MKSSFSFIVLLFLVLLCRGEARVCTSKIILQSPGIVCSTEICTPICLKAIGEGANVRAYCIASDTCNCIYHC
ncbi:hypothetical protein ABFS83_03G005700 [Erythranthe nasuta]